MIGHPSKHQYFLSPYTHYKDVKFTNETLYTGFTFLGVYVFHFVQNNLIQTRYLFD